MVDFYQKQKSDLHAALLARQSGLHERALSACPEHFKPSFSSAQQARLSQDFVGVELNDFVDILDASILDDDFESVHD